MSRALARAGHLLSQLATVSIRNLPAACASHNAVELRPYTNCRSIYALNHVLPTISKETFVAPSAELIGSVTLSNRSSVWYNAVLRGDLNTVLVGTGSSIEERSVLHAARSSPSGSVTGTTIGDYVRIGSGSVISSAVVDDGADIGERSVLCEGSMVERVAVLAPNSVLPPARRIPPGEVWGGNPAQFIRTLGEEEQAEMELRAERTFVNAQQHAFEFPENGMQYVQAEKVREMAQQVRNKNVSTGSSSVKE